MFWPGIVGDFMGYLPLTLIITLSSSLFVALVIVPTFCAILLRADDAPKRPMTPVARWTLAGVVALALLLVALANPLTAILLAATAGLLFALHTFILDRMARSFQARGLPWIVHRYERTLRWALDHRSFVMGGCAAVFVGTFGLFVVFNHGVEFFPEDIPPPQLIIDIEAPVGTRVAFTDGVARILEEEVKGLPGFSDVESVVATVGGSGGADPMGMGGPSGENQGRVVLSMVDFQDREGDSFDLLARLQEELGRGIPGVEIRANQLEQGPPGGPAVNIEVVGADPAVLKGLSDRILQILRNAPVSNRLVGIESDLDDARPELFVTVDRELASLYGLSTSEVGNAVRGAIQGVEAARYRTGNDEFDIIVRLAPQYRSELVALEEFVVVADGGAQIPLLSVASWEVGEGLGSIRRKDMDRLATISSEVRAGYNQNAVLAEVQETLASFAADELPPGYQLRYTGQLEEQMEAQEFLTLAFGIALMLIAFILISQFNSVVKPVIILTSVIMSTVGVLIGLMVFSMPFVIIMTGVGIISLAGIVVNNAIVLVDYIEILRNRDGMERREALVQGGMTRFRPVVLTAITTALGLVPLAIGLNFNFFGLFGSLSPDFYWGGEQAAWWSPMAIAVIVGIIFATFLTLVVVPVMYSIVDDVSDFFQRHFVPVPLDDAPPLGSEGAGGRAGPVRDGRGSPDGEPAPEEEPVPVYTRERPGIGGLAPEAG